MLGEINIVFPAEMQAQLNRIEHLLEQLLAGDPEERLNGRQACKLLQISERTLYQWRVEGKIEVEAEGNIVRYRRGEIIRLMREKNIPILRIA